MASAGPGAPRARPPVAIPVVALAVWWSLRRLHSQGVRSELSRTALTRTRWCAGLAWPSFGAIAFSGKAIIVKLAYRYGVDAVTLIMCRMLFALPMFAAMAWWASRGKAAAVAARLAGRELAWASPATTSPAFWISPACNTSVRRSSG